MKILREYGSIPRVLGVRNYLNNYFAMYKRLTLPRRLTPEEVAAVEVKRPAAPINATPPPPPPLPTINVTNP